MHMHMYNMTAINLQTPHVHAHAHVRARLTRDAVDSSCELGLLLLIHREEGRVREVDSRLRRGRG